MNNIEKLQECVSPRAIFRSRLFVCISVILSVSVICSAALVVYAIDARDSVLPRVSLGGVSLGGMSMSEAESFLASVSERRDREGVQVRITQSDGKVTDIVIPAVLVRPDDVQTVISLDKEVVLSGLFAHVNKRLDKIAFAVLQSFFTPTDAALTAIVVNEDAVRALMDEQFGPFEQKATDAQLFVSILSDGSVATTISSSSVGYAIPRDGFIDDIKRSWSRIPATRIERHVAVVQPDILEKDITEVLPQVASVLTNEIVRFLYTHPERKEDMSWVMKKKAFASVLGVEKKEGIVRLSISPSSTADWLVLTIEDSVNVPAQNARFAIAQGNTIAQFSGARSGVGVERNKVIDQLQETLDARMRGEAISTREFVLPVKIVEPEIKTADVNQLGITEILGVGYSSFTGSPAARIKNIRHGAMDKLHGRIIAPGEEFSLVTALKPFTLDDGYVPEKVIKGNKIETELGGGLCQIGSTMFRAAMNSGLSITERRSHGLVVPYYNDPRNGNPGTDATIYDPKPDLRFLNDTGNYILISVEMNEKKQELRFYLWGTSDGRKGSYTPPIVKKWIPHGEAIIVETTDLPPGKKDCQHAYTGAETSFVYTRILSSGETLEEVFESKYRPMASLCLVGVAPSSTPAIGEEMLPVPSI